MLRTAPPDPADLRRRIFLWAAYQERSPNEVRRKLRDWACPPNQIERLLEELQDENYVNEERFVKVFVGGKFRIKQWGRRKIAMAIQAHGVDGDLVAQALHSEIPEDDYTAVIEKLIDRKREQYIADGHTAPTDLRKRIADYLLQKGYEWEAIAEVLTTKLG